MNQVEQELSSIKTKLSVLNKEINGLNKYLEKVNRLDQSKIDLFHIKLCTRLKEIYLSDSNFPNIEKIYINKNKTVSIKLKQKQYQSFVLDIRNLFGFYFGVNISHRDYNSYNEWSIMDIEINIRSLASGQVYENFLEL